MYRRAGVLKAGAILTLIVFLQALVLPQLVQAQTTDCPFDQDNPSIENARYNFRITNYDCAEIELKTLLADENLDLQIKADAHVLLAAVYYAKIRDDEQKQNLVVEQFVAAFKAFRNWRGDLDIKSPEFVAMMEQAQVLVDKQDDAVDAAKDKVEEQLPEEQKEMAQVVPVSGDGKKPWYKQWWAIGLGVGLVATAVVVAAGGGGGDEGEEELPGFPPTPSKR